MSAKDNDSTVVLTAPVEFAGKTYKELKLTKPKVKALRAIQLPDPPGPMDLSIAIAACIAGVDEGVIDELNSDDWTALKKKCDKIIPLG